MEEVIMLDHVKPKAGCSSVSHSYSEVVLQLSKIAETYAIYIRVYIYITTSLSHI